MTTTATLQELMDYILANRRKDAFKDWPHNRIANSLIQASMTNTLGYCRGEDDKGKLTGVCVAYRNDEMKVIHVANVLTTEKGVLELMFLNFVNMFPNYSLTATRKEKLVRYDVVKLCAKILHKGKI